MATDLEHSAVRYEVRNGMSMLSRVAKDLCSAIETVLVNLEVFADPGESFWELWDLVSAGQMKLAHHRFTRRHSDGEALPQFDSDALLLAAAGRTEFHGVCGVGEVDILNQLASKVSSLLPPHTHGTQHRSNNLYNNMRVRMSNFIFPTQPQLQELAPLVVLQTTRAIEVFEDRFAKWLSSHSIPSQALSKGSAIRDGNSPQSCVRHGPDYRAVHWFGSDFTFTVKQAVIVRLLWNAWEAGTPDVSHAYLLEVAEVESNQTRFKELFRGSDAWNTMIVQGGRKGTARLKMWWTPSSRPKPGDS